MVKVSDMVYCMCLPMRVWTIIYGCMVGCGLSSYTVQEKKEKGPYTVTWMVGVGWCFNLVLSLDLVLA